MSLVPISDLFQFQKGTLQSSKCIPGKYTFITASSEWKTHNEYVYDCEALIFAAAASGSLGRTHYVNGKFISSDLCFILIPKNEKKYPIDLQFYHIIFNVLKDDIVRNTKAGTSKEAIGLKSFGNYRLPYFGIKQQLEVKSKFIAGNSYKEKLISEQSHQLELIKKLRQQILKDAMQGKLVPQNPKDEPASKLLEKIKAEKSKSGKKDKSLPQIKPEEIPFDIPESWVWSRLGEIADEIVYGTSEKAHLNGEIPVLRMGNISTDGKILYSNLKYVPSSISDLPKLYLENGDLVFNRTNSFELVGKCGVFESDESYTLASYLIRVRFFERISSKFLSNYINSSLCRETQIEPHIIQQNGQANFNGTKLSNIITPLPPFEEQKRIVSKIEQLMTLCDELEASVKANQEYTTLLYQTALKEALQPKAIEVKQEDLAIAAEPQADYNKGKVIDLPILQEKEDSHFVKRKVLATYIINQSLDDQQFGDVKFEKLLHLSDYFAIKRNLGQNYYQKVAGPLDNSFTIPFFEQIEKSKWFNRKKIGRQFQFSKAVNHSKSLNTYSYFSDEELAKVQKLIDYFKKSDYEKPEIISTLYAVWNNRIIKQQPINDALIKQDFLEWDENKAKYKDRLDGALAWMRKEGVVPDGWGKVIEKPKTKKKK